MAIIKCNECGAEISDKAKTCPRCGAPVNGAVGQEEESKRLILTLVSLGIFAVGFYLFWMGISTISSDLHTYRYTYRSPLTEHEVNMIFKAFIGAIMIGISAVLDLRLFKNYYKK